MPHALVEVRRPYTDVEEVAIIDAVHGALVTAFLIPPADKHIRFIAHKPHRFAAPPTLAQPDFFTLVSIDCFTGRSVQAKRNLYTEIVNRLAALGVPRDHVSILLRESDTENWGLRSGQAACDIDLGFDLHV